jgi:hypothetical protein
MVKVGNKTKHTGGAGGKRSVTSASLVRNLERFCTGENYFSV